MPTMVIPRDALAHAVTTPSILLASDSSHHGTRTHSTLQREGFEAQFAGDYSQLDMLLANQNFDMVLLEVTSAHAVEDAVAAALRVKRARAGQFVGYLADPALEACGLAGDGVFPRNAILLPAALRKFFAEMPEDPLP